MADPSTSIDAARRVVLENGLEAIFEGILRPLIGKLSTARCVDAPYNASSGTAISPMESRSLRMQRP